LELDFGLRTEQEVQNEGVAGEDFVARRKPLSRAQGYRLDSHHKGDFFPVVTQDSPWDFHISLLQLFWHNWLCTHPALNSKDNLR